MNLVDRAVNWLKHRNTYTHDMDFVAIDLELTGLDPDSDEIVSVAWVPIRDLMIIVGEAEHYYVRVKSSVGESAIIHGIHDRDLSGAAELCQVMKLFRSKFSSYVCVAHYAELERKFIRRALVACNLQPLQEVFVDTLKIELKRLDRKGVNYSSRNMTLAACLRRHNIPINRQHDALTDAFSCAQLFLCQVQKSGRDKQRLYEFL